MLIWTRSYRPFIMGGNVNAGMAVNMHVGEKLDLGKGFFGYSITNPNNGKTMIVEGRSGGIVGLSLNQVREDIAKGDVKDMEEQIENGILERNRARVETYKSFWASFPD